MFADEPRASGCRTSGLDWTLACPVMLVNGRRTGAYRVGERLGPIGLPAAPRAGVADFMLRETVERACAHRDRAGREVSRAAHPDPAAPARRSASRGVFGAPVHRIGRLRAQAAV